MKTKYIVGTLALAWTVSAVAQAGEIPEKQLQSPPAVLESAAAGTVVFDDDGGRAQIIPHQAVPKREPSFHGGPVVTGASVQALFLGSGWREKANRAMESRALESLTRQASGSGLPGMPGMPGALQEDLLDPLDGKAVSDLEIQRRLDALVTSGHEPVDAGVVFVVFLAPGLRSTLGTSSSEKDFAAYHNHYHSAAGVVRYVVVPYEGESSRWLGNARASLAQTLMNPEGNAWY
ncbi:MAG TPA: hypothetical protein VFE33_32685 [Thermoanaerobaculia bacterium]|nr:hypothetical protein [Thermoanaerobaculia bacterium]